MTDPVPSEAPGTDRGTDAEATDHATDQRTDQRTDQDDSLSYEDARDQLLEVVQALESGGTTLEEALALWERGERLAQVCQDWLDGARARLERSSQAE